MWHFQHFLAQIFDLAADLLFLLPQCTAAASSCFLQNTLPSTKWPGEKRQLLGEECYTYAKIPEKLSQGLKHPTRAKAKATRLTVYSSYQVQLEIMLLSLCWTCQKAFVCQHVNISTFMSWSRSIRVLYSCLRFHPQWPKIIKCSFKSAVLLGQFCS